MRMVSSKWIIVLYKKKLALRERVPELALTRQLGPCSTYEKSGKEPLMESALFAHRSRKASVEPVPEAEG